VARARQTNLESRQTNSELGAQACACGADAQTRTEDWLITNTNDNGLPVRSFPQLLPDIADHADNLPWHLSGSIDYY
jgi:hypothetical protein